jgi:NDP-4-keto-2,6-dideoxyhexose 3-C-methyltransferase
MKIKFRKIDKCRICGNQDLEIVLDLGIQYLAGNFPKDMEEHVEKGPLKLVKCTEKKGSCGHVQLEHTYNLNEMYGDNYGYRSGLNSSMVKHLNSKYLEIIKKITFSKGDVVVDIAGNDGTFLGFFPSDLNLLSIDPTSEKFSKFYKSHVKFIPDFFSQKIYNKIYNSKAKLVTSFSMFYDLEDPISFAKEINEILDPNDGIWFLEQSYMPEMLKQNSFDTICHEHLSYYGLRQLKYILDNSNFKIVDIEFNNVNGGSISLMVCNKNSNKYSVSEQIETILLFEKEIGLHTNKPWIEFGNRIDLLKDEFWRTVKKLKSQGLSIAILGASTKGNVLLQKYEISAKEFPEIGDINIDKFNCFSPGTLIPIVSEKEVVEKYDVFVVLPWHFKNFFISSSTFKNKQLLFPLPKIEIVKIK